MKGKILMAAVVALIVSSCKKDGKEDSSSGIGKDCLIAKVIGVQKWNDTGKAYSTTYEYIYDGENISTIIANGMTWGSGNTAVPAKFTITRTDAGSTYAIANGNGNREIFTLDGSGRIIKKAHNEDDGYTAYEYNADGTLKQSKLWEGEINYSATTYTWSNGNLIKIEDKYANEVDVVDFEYTTEAALPNYDGAFNYWEDWKWFGYSTAFLVQNYGTGILGKTSKNRLKTIKSGNGELNFTYEFNGNDVKVITINSKLNRTETYNITYTCK